MIAGKYLYEKYYKFTYIIYAELMVLILLFNFFRWFNYGWKN